VFLLIHRTPHPLTYAQLSNSCGTNSSRPGDPASPPSWLPEEHELSLVRRLRRGARRHASRDSFGRHSKTTTLTSIPTAAGGAAAAGGVTWVGGGAWTAGGETEEGWLLG
jgi:hypothetical protein